MYGKTFICYDIWALEYSALIFHFILSSFAIVSYSALCVNLIYVNMRVGLQDHLHECKKIGLAAICLQTGVLHFRAFIICCCWSFKTNLWLYAV